MSSPEPTGGRPRLRHRALIAVCRWTYAKTVPEAPHEYCLRAWLSPDQQADFDWFVALIAEHGYRGRFWRQEWVYLDVDDQVLGVPDPGRDWRDHQPGSPGGGDGLALQHAAGASPWRVASALWRMPSTGHQSVAVEWVRCS